MVKHPTYLEVPTSASPDLLIDSPKSQNLQHGKGHLWVLSRGHFEEPGAQLIIYEDIYIYDL